MNRVLVGLVFILSLGACAEPTVKKISDENLVAALRSKVGTEYCIRRNGLRVNPVTVNYLSDLQTMIYRGTTSEERNAAYAKVWNWKPTPADCNILAARAGQTYNSRSVYYY